MNPFRILISALILIYSYILISYLASLYTFLNSGILNENNLRHLAYIGLAIISTILIETIFKICDTLVKINNALTTIVIQTCRIVFQNNRIILELREQLYTLREIESLTALFVDSDMRTRVGDTDYSD